MLTWKLYVFLSKEIVAVYRGGILLVISHLMYRKVVECVICMWESCNCILCYSAADEKKSVL